MADFFAVKRIEFCNADLGRRKKILLSAGTENYCSRLKFLKQVRGFLFAFVS